MEFLYEAKTKTGEVLEGRIEAPNENVAVETLQEKEYTVIALRPIATGLFDIDLAKFVERPNTKDIVIFTRQLSTLIDAGMPLAEGLRTLSQQMQKASFKKIISEVADTVEGGSSLSTTLGGYPKLFSPFYVKLVRSGELSGKLHESLQYLADYLERSQDINSKIRGALAYPAFVVFAMIVVTMIMTVYVLPELLNIFKEAGVGDLPFTTKALIWFTDFFNENLAFIMFGLVASSIAFWRFIRTEKGHAWLDMAKLKVPIFGVIMRNLYLARMAESLSTLIKSDIAILDVIKLTSDIVGNVHYRNILLDAEESVRGGGSMSEVFAKYAEIPPLMTSMILVGERTGKVEFMLGHVSRFYRTESENDIANIAQLIEPILVLALGAGVGLLVASVLLPIYSMVG